MAEIDEQMLLEIWSLIKENVPVAKRQELAEQFLSIVESYGCYPDEMDDFKGVDVYIDTALTTLYFKDEEDESPDEE